MGDNELKRIDDFLAYLSQVKRYSPLTVQNYGRDLCAYRAFVANTGLDHWADVKPHQVRQYAAQLHRQGNSGRSIQRKLSAIRSFYRYLMREGNASANPADAVTAPKSARKLPSVVDVDQMSELLSQTDADQPLLVRDLAIMELLYSSGLRLSELVGLDLRSLDLNDGTVRVTGKGGKTRVVPIGRFARERLGDWLKLRTVLAGSDEAAVFVNRQGSRIATRTVQQRLRQWGVRHGVAGSLHPHRFRHSFASHLLESSGDIRAVQELLGHANISTTQVYTHLDYQHLATVYDKAHPRARKRKDKA